MYGNYYPSLVLSVVNYVSTVFASMLYIFILVKFYKSAKKNSLTLPNKVTPIVETGA